MNPDSPRGDPNLVTIHLLFGTNGSQGERDIVMTMAANISKAEKVTKSCVTGLCAGANLRTPCGPRRIEFLRVGDLVVTRDNGLQPVRMVWTKTFSATEIAADPSLAPIVLKTRAVGPMMPQRDLSVAPGHRLLIPGWRLEDEADNEACLVPARDISDLNDNIFVDRAPDEVVFYNVVFDEPQVISANGLPVESFMPTQEAMKSAPKAVRDDLKKVFPDIGPKFTDYPAPRYKMRDRVSYIPDYA